MTHVLALIATFYAPHFDGRQMANQRIFHQRSAWCASGHHPLGARLRLTNGTHTAYCTVGDRPGRDVLDLSRSVFTQLAPAKQGVIRNLRVEEVAEAK